MTQAKLIRWFIAHGFTHVRPPAPVGTPERLQPVRDYTFDDPSSVLLEPVELDVVELHSYNKQTQTLVFIGTLFRSYPIS